VFGNGGKNRENFLFCVRELLSAEKRVLSRKSKEDPHSKDATSNH
jgi:hypothetical protein